MERKWGKRKREAKEKLSIAGKKRVAGSAATHTQTGLNYAAPELIGRQSAT